MLTRHGNKRPSEDQENPAPKKPYLPAWIPGLTSSSTQIPATQFPSTGDTPKEPTQTPQDNQTPPPQPSFTELVDHVISITVTNKELQDSNRETNERLDKLSKNLELLTNALTDNAQTTASDNSNHAKPPTTMAPADPRIVYGNTPQEILANHVSWLTESVIAEVILRKLEIKDLIKLLPEEERPKGRTVPHRAGVFFDIASKTTTVTEGGATAYDKDIPDFPTLISILSTYGMLRNMFDQDNTSIGTAILSYVRTLSKWYKHDNYTFRSIRAYFIAHFRKYQTSNDPNVWMAVDTQLFIANVRPAPPPNDPYTHREYQSPSKRPNGHQGGQPAGGADHICHNYNIAKGCSWSACPRQHTCKICQGRHPAHQCYKRSTNFGSRPEKA